MAKGKQATQRLSPTKAILHFRMAESERQLKLVTEKHNLLAKQVADLIEKHNAVNDSLKMTTLAQGRLIKMVMVMEELIETKLGITAEDVVVAEAKVTERVAENEKSLQALMEKMQQNTAEQSPPAEQVVGEVDTAPVSEEAGMSATEDAQETRPALHAV